MVREAENDDLRRVAGLRPGSHTRHAIGDDAGGPGLGGQLTGLDDLQVSVVADAADVVALGCHDRIEQRCVAEPAVDDVGPLGSEMGLQDGLLIAGTRVLWSGQVEPVGDRIVDVQLEVEPPAVAWRAIAVVAPLGLDQAREGVEQGAVDGCQAAVERGQSRVPGGLGLVANQLGQDVAEGLGVEDASRLGKRAEGGVGHGEAFADRLQVTDPHQRAVAACQGLKESQDDQGQKIVEVELAVLGLVASRALVMEVGEERPHAGQRVERVSRDGQCGIGLSCGGHDQR